MLDIGKMLEAIEKFSKELEMELEKAEKARNTAVKFLKEIYESDYFDYESCRGAKPASPPSFRTFNIQTNHAISILEGLKICGVDGSQIEPSKDFGVPVGAIQTVGLEVHHGKGEFRKHVEFSITSSDVNISLERFKAECEMMMNLMDGDRYIFYDGSFVLSFTKELASEIREDYINSVCEVLEKSETTSTPVIGVVDVSKARDVVVMLETLRGVELQGIYDTSLFMEFLEPGMATQPFICLRDIIKYYRKTSEICFQYINMDGNIVRIEYPVWLLEDEWKLVEVVISECRLGSSGAYPYVLERSHAEAVISQKERFEFYRLIGMKGVSRKWISKVM
jgi:hypothetical protein